MYNGCCEGLKLYSLEELAFEVKYIKDFIEGARGILEKIRRVRGSRVFLLFMDRFRSIDQSLPEIMHGLIGVVNGDLDIILYSNGGLGDQAYVAGRYLQENVSGKISFIIPRWAKSAATMLSCSGDEIVMTRIAELGPIDPVVYVEKTHRYVPALSLIELFKILPQLGLPEKYLRDVLDKLPLLEIGDYKRVLEHNVELTTKLLTNRMFRDEPDKAKNIARRLASYKYHGAPITIYDAEEIGLKVKPADKELEELLIRLHSLWEETILDADEKFSPVLDEPVNILVDSDGVIMINIQSELLPRK
jgi:hypothetical protein